MATERVTIGPREPIVPSESNLSPNSASAGKSGAGARSIDPDSGTRANTPRKFAPNALFDPTEKNRTLSTAVGNQSFIEKNDVSTGELAFPARSEEATSSQGAHADENSDSSLLAGRPVGDQKNMPKGVVPRNRMLAENELSQNPLNTFLQDPSSFAASYFINTMRNFVMPGRTVPEARPGETVNGSDNVVGFTLNRVDGHNAEMTLTGVPSELGRPGTPSSSLAYYLPFTNGGATTIRVPRNPAADDPQFLLTGPFTGCSFYAQEDPTDPNFLLFTHDPRRGVGTTTSPTGIPPGGVGISYDSTYGQEDGMLPTQVPSASAFAYYDRATSQWIMNVQHAVVEVPLNPSGIPGAPVQRQRNPGRIEGAFIPIIFRNTEPQPIVREADNSDRSGPSGETSFWTAFEAGGATGAVIGGGVGIELGPGAVVTAGAGGLIGAAIGGTAWLFNWAQHQNSRP